VNFCVIGGQKMWPRYAKKESPICYNQTDCLPLCYGSLRGGQAPHCDVECEQGIGERPI